MAEGKRFCPSCGTEAVSPRATLCLKCGGQLVPPNTTHAPADPDIQVDPQHHGRGHWEYQEFSESLGELKLRDKNKGFFMNSFPLTPSLPNTNPSIGPLLGEAAHRLVNRLSVEGWEPTDPYDPLRLWTMKRVQFRYSRNHYIFESLHINFRRWVE